MKTLLQTFVLIVTTNWCFAQTKAADAAQNFLTADSIIIASHIYGYVKKAGKKTMPINNSLLVNNRANYEIIKQRYKLNKIESDTLFNLLSAPNKDTKIEMASCFEPHHAILFFNSNHCSYIDIFFSCRKLVSSKDANFFQWPSKTTWEKLELFFRNRKLNYDIMDDR